MQDSNEKSLKGGSPKNGLWLQFAILLLISVAVNLLACSGKLLADDFTWINLLSQKPWETLLSGFHQRYMYYAVFGEHFRPLLTVPFLFDVVLCQNNPILLHLSNVLWNAACVGACYFVSVTWLEYFKFPRSKALEFAFWVGMLFAVHPFHVENIAWWTAKNDLVFSFFYLLALTFFFIARNEGAQEQRPDPLLHNSSRGLSLKTSSIAYHAFFVIALLCKESAITFPLLLAYLIFSGTAPRQFIPSNHDDAIAKVRVDDEPGNPNFGSNLALLEPTSDSGFKTVPLRKSVYEGAELLSQVSKIAVLDRAQERDSKSSSKNFASLNFRERLQGALVGTWKLWALVAAFWIARYCALGQLGGSYYGVLTNLWFETAGIRFGNLRADSIFWFPVDMDDALFSRSVMIAMALTYVISIVATLALYFRYSKKSTSPIAQHNLIDTRAFSSRSLDDCLIEPSIEPSGVFSFKNFVFSILFFLALTLLPSCLVWTPNTSLEGTRLLYLSSMPLCMLYCVPAIFLTRFALRVGERRLLQGILAAFALLFAVSTWQAYTRWSCSSNYCERLLSEVSNELKRSSTGSDGVGTTYLVNFPRSLNGVSLFHHFPIFVDAFKPPFSSGEIAARLQGLQPHFFWNTDCIPRWQLKRLAEDPQSEKLLLTLFDEKILDRRFFDVDKIERAHFLPLSAKGLLSGKRDAGIRSFTVAESAQMISVDGQRWPAYSLALSPPVNGSSHNLLRLHFRKNSERHLSRLRFLMYWKNSEMAQFKKNYSCFFDEPYEIDPPQLNASATSHQNDSTHTGDSTGHVSITICLAENVKWIGATDIDALSMVPLDDCYKLEKIEIANIDSQLPQLSPSIVSPTHQLKDGVVHGRGGTLEFAYDASMIPHCSKVLVEASPAQVDFFIASRKQLDAAPNQKTIKSFTVEARKGNFSISEKLGSPVWHQVRVLPLSENGSPQGYASRPVYVQSKSARSFAEESR